MSKILFILMQNHQETEFTVPYEILSGAGHSVDVAGLTPGVVTGAKGRKFTPNLLLSDMEQKDFDQYEALVIPGGPGSKEHLWDNETVAKTIKYFHENKKIVAAICYAVIAVVKTGMLLHKHATVYPTDEAKAILEEYGVKFSKDSCVTLAPEKIITAQGPASANDFGQSILNLLK